MTIHALGGSGRPARPRFRLTPPPIPELDIHQACAAFLDRCLLPPAMWFAYPAGHVQLTGAQLARLAKIGLKRGLPDLWILYSGCAFAVELKKTGARLSKTHIGRTSRGAPRIYEGQEDVFPRLQAAGVLIAVCHSIDEVVNQLQKWGIPLRSHALGQT